MAGLVVAQHKQPSFAATLYSSLSVFNNASFAASIQYKSEVWQPKGALRVNASSAQKILIIGGTRFIGLFLSRLLKEGLQDVK